MRALGPGILLASAAVGGSHLIASTQAGALYGWQLAVIIVLVNVLKYPFSASAPITRWIAAKVWWKAMPTKAGCICGYLSC